jgi:tetratricopeptide (TPR) repeat protein
MSEETESLIATATELAKNRRFAEAASRFEKAAAVAGDRKRSAGLLRMAAQAYEKTRQPEDAVRCCVEAAGLLEKTKKAECLMDGFGIYVSAIAGYEWDCGFEWRGATDGSHSDDHEFYQGEIAKYQKEAEQLLRQALDIKGARRKTILRLARKEYERRRKEGGWGAARCLEIISRVTEG